VNVLDISKIAATNSTDGQGFEHRMVFFQDIYSSLIVVRWDSQNQTWTPSNLTDASKLTTWQLSMPAGTAMSAASVAWGRQYEVHLWYLTSRSTIGAVGNFDLFNNPNFWQAGFGDGLNVPAWKGSQLAGAWQRCRKQACIGLWALAYQTTAGDIRIANASSWTGGVNAVDKSSVVVNSSLALVPSLTGDAMGVGLNLASQSVNNVSAGSGSIDKTAFTTSQWVSGKLGLFCDKLTQLD
jgi:hypothetical protein